MRTMAGIAWVALMMWVAGPTAGWAQDKDKDEVINKLNSVKTSVSFNNTPLGVAIEHIREAGGGLNIHIADHIRDQFAGESPKTVSLKVENVSLRTVLKLILQADENYAVIYKNRTLLITTKDKAQQEMVTVIYDVRDLLFQTVDFPGPRVDLLPPDTYQEKFGNKGGGALTGGVFSLDSGDKTPLNTDFIQNMLKQNTGSGEGSWGDPAFIEEKNGYLWVRNTKMIHKEVARFVGLLRQIKH